MDVWGAGGVYAVVQHKKYCEKEFPGKTKICIFAHSIIYKAVSGNSDHIGSL